MKDDMSEAELDASSTPTRCARRKAARDKIIATKTEKRGLLVVHTGKGKGKSTAAFGMIFRCARSRNAGRHRPVRQGQVADRRARRARKFGDLVSINTMGEGFTWETQDRQRDLNAARAAWETGEGDHAFGPTSWCCSTSSNRAPYDYLPLDEVVSFCVDELSPPDVHVIVTGRNAARN